MDTKLLTELNGLRSKRKAVLVVDNLVKGTSVLVHEGESHQWTDGRVISEVIDNAFKNGKSGLVTLEDQQYFINVYLPPTRLVTIGAVHISQHLAEITRTTGFNLEIIDPRTAFATPERFEDVELYADWPEDVLQHKPLDPYCALIAVTHDPKIDDFAIVSALKAGCFYVGALGSRKTHAKRLDRLKGEGISDTQLQTIHAPIGLDIHAANPAEIAVAILAEVIMAFRTRGTGAS